MQFRLLKHDIEKMIQADANRNHAHENKEMREQFVVMIKWHQELIRAQTPCKLTASNFSEVNLKAFMKILSTAWSYFALLQTLYGAPT
ncbi:unnamed protein product [Chrysodeixis includens]|uniref:Uncharacterized protein n=1 Tax=Chrysodeixis includens TaxID=689277 RepID=A0A9N8Q1R4_CHRIL|nr:unnamed protein product [Chrysodeixis includens]